MCCQSSKNAENQLERERQKDDSPNLLMKLGYVPNNFEKFDLDVLIVSADEFS